VAIVGGIIITVCVGYLIYRCCCGQGNEGLSQYRQIRVIGEGGQGNEGLSQYRQIRVIGEGGQGQVLLMKRLVDGKEVALKLIVCRTSAERDCALEEFRVLQRLQGQQNVVRLIDFLMNWSANDPNQAESFMRSGVDIKPIGPAASYPYHAVNLNHQALDDERAGDAAGLLGTNAAAPLVFSDVLRHENRWCAIVTEYIPHGDLAQFVRKHFPLNRTTGGGGADYADRTVPIGFLQKIMYDLLRFLYHIHSLSPQILHRDLKPENILMDVDHDRLLITDFGIAKEVQADKGGYATFRIQGTHHYMPPEAFVAKQYGQQRPQQGVAAVGGDAGSPSLAGPTAPPSSAPASHFSAKGDIWAVGCIALAVIKRAFTTSEGAEMVAITARSPTFPDDVRQLVARLKYPDTLAKVVLACLVLDPTKRPSAGDLLREYDRWLCHHNFTLRHAVREPK